MFETINTGSTLVVVGAVLAGSQTRNLVDYLMKKLEQVMSIEDINTRRITLPASPLAHTSDMSLEN